VAQAAGHHRHDPQHPQQAQVSEYPAMHAFIALHIRVRSRSCREVLALSRSLRFDSCG
jgi:hypothetical protein